MNNRTSDSQVKASRKWEEKNPIKAKYIRARTSARSFVRHWATKEDLEELIEIFNNENDRDEYLKKLEK